MKQLDIEKDYGILTAVILDKIIHVKEGEGINISFVAEEGKTILNGVTIQKL